MTDREQLQTWHQRLWDLDRENVEVRIINTGEIMTLSAYEKACETLRGDIRDALAASGETELRNEGLPDLYLEPSRTTAYRTALLMRDFPEHFDKMVERDCIVVDKRRSDTLAEEGLIPRTYAQFAYHGEGTARVKFRKTEHRQKGR